MIDLKILALLSPNGFDERFWKYAKETKTYVEAYEKTEMESNFKNFRSYGWNES